MLSTISRTALAKLLTITLAEDVLGLVSKGTHHYGKYVRREELWEFVAGGGGEGEEGKGGLGWYPHLSSAASQGEGTGKPSAFTLQDAFEPVSASASSAPSRLQMESRGILYSPLRSDWVVLERGGWLQESGWGEECNYLFWARKPVDAVE